MSRARTGALRDSPGAAPPAGRRRGARPPSGIAGLGAAAALALGLAGCAVGPDYRTPDLPLPERYASAGGAAAVSGGAPVDLAAWWRALGDPRLDALIERAVRDNPGLEIALARLQQARTYEVLVTGRALPFAEASAGGGYGTGSDLTRGRAAQGLVAADSTAGLSHLNELGGFDAFWELDLFGRLRREIEAARYDSQALAEARSAVLTALVADVVRGYLDMRGLQAEALVLRAAEGVLKESLRVTHLRFERGITNELDETLARRELAALQSQIAPVEAQVAAAQDAIAVLLGAWPETIRAELAAPAPAPPMPGGIAPGTPVELLRRRPDIRQAERELAAATARTGVAIGNLFPRVALTGSIGAQAQGLDVSPSLGRHIWSFGPSVIWPLLDFGALDAQIEIADLETRARLANYRRLILEAVRDVDTAMQGYAAELDRERRLSEALVASQRAVTLATERYERGLTDFLNVIDAERQQYSIEAQYASAQVSQGRQFVAIFKALGGGWEHYQAVPPVRTPRPALMALIARTTGGGRAPAGPPAPPGASSGAGMSAPAMTPAAPSEPVPAAASGSSFGR